MAVIEHLHFLINGEESIRQKAHPLPFFLRLPFSHIQVKRLRPVRQEYYFRFLREDLLGNVFGRQAAEAFSLFGMREQKRIVAALFSLYRSGHGKAIFRKLMTELYVDSIVYEGRDRAEALYLYNADQFFLIQRGGHTVDNPVFPADFPELIGCHQLQFPLVI